MEYRVLWKAGLRRHRGSLAGILLLTFLVSLALGTVLTVWQNSQRYVTVEMDRAGFGDLTAWVSQADDLDALSSEIAALPQVKRVERQPLIFSNYTVNEQESDSEGQLIPLSANESRYRFYTNDLSGYREEIPAISPGEVYVSPSLISMFDAALGDEITFPIARAGRDMVFTVKGFYEDPFMGSSMIGMKGFLVCEADYQTMEEISNGSGIDALARPGAMLHIFAASPMTATELNSVINENTDLPRYAQFVHSAEAIRGFMLILQNAFSGLLIAFVMVLLVTVFIALGHSIGNSIEADYANMGILKALGCTSGLLRRLQLLQYGGSILIGMALGLTLTPPVSRCTADATLTTTGIRIPTTLPALWCLGAFGGMAALFVLFITAKTAKIQGIAPMGVIRGKVTGSGKRAGNHLSLAGSFLTFRLAARQLMTGKKKYFTACLVAVLLVFFASMIGRMDSWLGPDGKGMMDAFNPADHDLGVQTFGALDEAEAEEVVLSYTGITDSYVLAMPGVSMNGVDYTANVIDQPERFHILDGQTCIEADEVVITEFIAADQGLSIGDTVTVTAALGSETYTVSGIYSCANDMGGNIGMSREGYLAIGMDDPQIWCHHYFLSDPSVKETLTEALENTYGGDIHIHENTWPGLFGIISAMQALVVFMYAMVVAFILVVTAMTGSKLLAAEQRDTGIYKAIGFQDSQLRWAFALRFGIVALIGGAVGTVLAAVFTDPLVSSVMKLAGISNFVSHPGIGSILAPSAIVTVLFIAFAYLSAGKIKHTDLTVLISE